MLKFEIISNLNDLLNTIKEAKPKIKADLLEVEDKERFMEKKQIANTPMNEMLHLDDIQLPYVDDLYDTQIKIIMNSISDLLVEFNSFLKFPEGIIPASEKYKLFREKFTEPISFKELGKFYYDFCPGWCPDCELADYCNERKNLWTDDEEFNFCKKPE